MRYHTKIKFPLPCLDSDSLAHEALVSISALRSTLTILFVGITLLSFLALSVVGFLALLVDIA